MSNQTLGIIVVAALCLVHVYNLLRGPLRRLWHTWDWLCACGARAFYVRGGRRCCRACAAKEEAAERELVASARDAVATQPVVAVSTVGGIQFVGRDEAVQRVTATRRPPAWSSEVT